MLQQAHAAQGNGPQGSGNLSRFLIRFETRSGKHLDLESEGINLGTGAHMLTLA